MPFISALTQPNTADTRPRIPILLNSTPITGLADTGSTSTILSTRLATKLKLPTIPHSARAQLALDTTTCPLHSITYPLTFTTPTHTCVAAVYVGDLWPS